MRIFRKLIICFVVITMLPFGSIVSADAEKGALTIYDKGTSLLTKIGVVDNTDLQRDEKELVTRAEFAMLAVRLRGWEKVAYEQNQNRYFYDVDPEYYETRYINLAASTGLMDAVEAGYFVPAKAITLDDAVKTLVNVLGYGAVAKARGGETEDYVLIASQKGILEGVNTKADALTRGDIYRMMINTLEVDILKEITFGEKIEYNSIKNENLLSEYHCVYSSEGIITANRISALNADEKRAGNEKIMINNTLYTAKEVASHELLGYNVKYYYKDNDNELELIYAYKEDNESLVLKPSDIIDFANLKYTYFDEDEEMETAEVKGAYFIYNGKAMSGNNDGFIPNTGSVELIDNDNDGGYDVVKIYSYQEYLVDSVNLKENIIKTSVNEKLELKKDKVTIVNGAFEKQIGLDAIKIDSVIWVGRDSSGEIVTVISNQAFVVGAMSRMSMEDDWTAIIDGETYRVSASLKDAIINGDEKPFEIGTVARYDLNLDGEIAYWSKNYKQIGDSAWELAILRGAELGRFGESLKIRAITSANQFDNFIVEKKVVLDDETCSDMNKLYRKLSYDSVNGVQKDSPVAQVFRFKLNEDGMVTHIDLVGEKDSQKEGIYIADTYPSDYGNMWYSSNSMAINGEVAINTNTGLFVYPGSINNMDLSDENKVYYSRAVDYLQNNLSYNNYTVYKVDPEQIEASLICLIGSVEREIPTAGYLNILLDISNVLDKDGEEVTQLTYAQDSKTKKTAIVSKNIDLNSIPVNDGTRYQLKKGDGFRCVTDSFGEIVYIQPIYDYRNHKPLGKSFDNTFPSETGFLRPREAEQFYVGYVNRFKNDILEGVYSVPYSSGDKKFSYNISKATIYVYDSKTKELTMGTYNDIYDYLGNGNECSKLVMRTHWYAIYQLFIIK